MRRDKRCWTQAFAFCLEEIRGGLSPLCIREGLATPKYIGNLGKTQGAHDKSSVSDNLGLGQVAYESIQLQFNEAAIIMECEILP